eukprot:CAMPEP_0204250924 /NCGR_PEP_ID=MMETSP0361-20130328/100411_1 /ASSEMBLY_ACC=CAM_ASM_000343 /TAXON_ID=268821 /ORGANISM="Scrippsiella Hangoei, Strain SHTV-5" /LENGTH=119 /DNA_ID=CAMNT_0051224197 /DNA_START=148 /DNA_END=509 /DNA_ORIENTATION=-
MPQAHMHLASATCMQAAIVTTGRRNASHDEAAKVNTRKRRLRRQQDGSVPTNAEIRELKAVMLVNAQSCHKHTCIWLHATCMQAAIVPTGRRNASHDDCAKVNPRKRRLRRTAGCEFAN